MEQTEFVNGKQGEAYFEIKERIISGEFSPGTLLVERTLSDLLGMSRTPIRAALMDLCHNGLAAFTPGKGVIVAEIGINDIHEIYSLRALVDPAVLLSFMKNATAEQIGQLQIYADKMSDAARCGNVNGVIENDIAFHQYYTDYCGNAHLWDLIMSVVDLFRRFRNLTASDTEMNLVFVQEHQLIMRAVRENDQSEAEVQMKAHYSHLKRYHIERFYN